MLILLAFLTGFGLGSYLSHNWQSRGDLIMARPIGQGGIDYQDGGFSSGGQVYALSGDLGELAARLGSVVTHNREGSVVHIETFEHGLQGWEKTTGGTGAEYMASAEASRSGGYSCKLIAGSDGSRISQIFRKFPYPVLGRYGLEFSVKLGEYTQDIVWNLSYHDGTDEHSYMCKYLVSERTVQVRDENGVFQDIVSDLYLTYAYSGFHAVKLVVDLANDDFVRLIINEVEYDLSDYSAYVFVEDDGPNVRVAIQERSEVGQNGYSYFDDIILTQNEPEH